MKTCPKCLKSEPDVTFGIARSRYDGKTPYCRTCWTLYVQQRRWAKGTKPVPPFLERLWEGVHVCEHGIDCAECCWPWTKGRDEDGYGDFSLTNAAKQHVKCKATNILWEIWSTLPIPSGYVVCHYCDSPPCCNPWHFWLGTLAQNRADCVQKGRQAKGQNVGQVLHPELFPRGEAHHKAKLTATDVLDIRAASSEGTSAYSLSKLYGVSKFNILAILHRKTWKHI